MGRPDDRASLPHRVLAFVVIFGTCAGLSVISLKAGAAIAFAGSILMAVILWFVALRRGPWQLTEHYFLRYWVCISGLIAVGITGTPALAHTVLAARGELMEVEVLEKGRADENGDRTYYLFRASDVEMLPDTLETDRELDEDAVFTLLVDPAGFVPPIFPEKHEPLIWGIVALSGTGVLAATVIGLGFPLGDRRYKKDPPEE